MQTVVCRDDAKARGLKRYFTGQPCRRGHLAERQTSTGVCVACNYEHIKAWRRAGNRDSTAETLLWKARHPEKARANYARYVERNRDRLLPIWAARAAKRRADNPDKVAANLAAMKTKYQAKLEALAGRPKPLSCEICDGTEDRIVFDHCHATGGFRGWICDRCNKTLGHVKDDPSILLMLAAYLEFHANGETEQRAA